MRISQSNLTKNLANAPHGRLSDALRGRLADNITKMPDPATATDTTTLTPAQLLSWLLYGTPTGAANYTLPTAADLDEALGDDFEAGDAFELNIHNLATGAALDITILTNTGWTLVGPMVIEAQEATQVAPSTGRFWARKTGDAAYELHRVA